MLHPVGAATGEENLLFGQTKGFAMLLDARVLKVDHK